MGVSARVQGQAGWRTSVTPAVPAACFCRRVDIANLGGPKHVTWSQKLQVCTRPYRTRSAARLLHDDGLRIDGNDAIKKYGASYLAGMPCARPTRNPCQHSTPRDTGAEPTGLPEARTNSVNEGSPAPKAVATGECERVLVSLKPPRSVRYVCTGKQDDDAATATAHAAGGAARALALGGNRRRSGRSGDGAAEASGEDGALRPTSLPREWAAAAAAAAAGWPDLLRPSQFSLGPSFGGAEGKPAAAAQL